MTIEKIKEQKILEIASMRLKMIITEGNQEIILKLPPAPDVEGIIVLWQRRLPSIS